MRSVTIHELFSVQLCTLTQPLFTVFWLQKQIPLNGMNCVCKKKKVLLKTAFTFFKPKNWDTKNQGHRSSVICAVNSQTRLSWSQLVTLTLWANTSHSLSGFWAPALWVWSSECLKRFKNFCKCAVLCLKVTQTNDEREWKWDNVSSAH